MSQSSLNDRARTALHEYVGAVAKDQSDRIATSLAGVRAAIDAGQMSQARDTLRQTVDELIVLGHVVDHAARAVGLPCLDWPLDRGVTKPLESLEADLGAHPGLKGS